MADFNEIFIRKMVQLLEDSTWTSASPNKENTVKDIREVTFGSDFDQAFEAAVVEAVEEHLVANPPKAKEEEGGVSTALPVKKGITESQGVSMTRQGMSLAQNPTDIVSLALQRLPHAVMITFAISLAPLIFEQLTRPGGPIDLRFKRMIDDEINAFLSRQTQKDTEFGYRQVVIQSKLGFTAPNGVNNYNTVRGIREGGLDKERLDRIGMVDHTKGDWPFG